MALPDDPPIPKTLTALAEELGACRRCPLYRDATQAVPGRGPSRARLMLVGEQPGNDEDLKGEPFVGPAGRVLDAALEEAGIERRKAFVTNAVKHFKFESRGKMRLHKRPNTYEIQRCRWWLEREHALVRPALTVALGATAAGTLYGKTVTIGKLRGKITTLEEWGAVLVTIHPSMLLRIPDEADKRVEQARFVRDLRVARDFLADL